MARRTPLHREHVDAGAKLVDFAGWEMPLHYGSQIEEHHAVRAACGMFDVSHMAVIDIGGARASNFLRRMVANDVAKLDDLGAALYGLLLNDSGGVIDDVIVYRREHGYRMVANAGNRGKVIGWLGTHGGEAVTVTERDLAMIAVQGPRARSLAASVIKTVDLGSLAPFRAVEDADLMVACTGYTGEDGIEVTLPGDAARRLWSMLLDLGVPPAGLGARDTLRLEAGFNLCGHDMDESVSPLVSNLAWTISWHPEDRKFIGREALQRERTAGAAHKLTGLVLEGRGVMREGQRVACKGGDGTVTSGIFSPTLGYSIALARVPRNAKGVCEVEIRGRMVPARIVKPPFVRRGQQVFE